MRLTILHSGLVLNFLLKSKSLKNSFNMTTEQLRSIQIRMPFSLLVDLEYSLYLQIFIYSFFHLYLSRVYKEPTK